MSKKDLMEEIAQLRIQLEQNNMDSMGTIVHSLQRAKEFINMANSFISAPSTGSVLVKYLVDDGAFDVAKSYIDLLKAREEKKQEEMIKIKREIRGITVSAIRRKTMKKNNGADFGPDTKGTETSGIQEAITKAFKVNKTITDKAETHKEAEKDNEAKSGN